MPASTGSLRGRTYSPAKGSMRSFPLGVAGLTIQIGVLDVDGFSGLVIGRTVWVVGRGHQHLQRPFGEAWLEHHAAAPHAHILTARVQGADAHRDCRPERKLVRPRTGQCAHSLSLKPLPMCCPFLIHSLSPSHSCFRLGFANPMCVPYSCVSTDVQLILFAPPPMSCSCPALGPRG